MEFQTAGGIILLSQALIRSKASQLPASLNYGAVSSSSAPGMGWRCYRLDHRKSDEADVN
jgi:hypothetical protein